MHPIQIGTCGWSYKDWVGVFYPEKTPAANFLQHYAHQYPIVEVDGTFYRSPTMKMTEDWRTKTPAGFGFSLKVPQVITHEKILQDCDKEVETFLAAAKKLGDKLRCCILQFGYFNRKAFAGLDAFLDRLEPFLETWPKDVPAAVEVRNKSWMTAKLADVLRRHQAVWVLTDQLWMPSPLEVIEKMDAVTGPFAYIRLLGDRKEVDARTKTLNRIVVDRAEQILATAEAIRRLGASVPVVVFVNNHYAGYAPETVKQLQAAL